MCVCVCVRQREREKERESERVGERVRESGREAVCTRSPYGILTHHDCKSDALLLWPTSPLA